MLVRFKNKSPMADHVAQWLNEVKTLQEQLQSVRDSEASAYASADNWRKRYEIEAEQRRNEAALMQHTIDALRAEIEQIKNRTQAQAELEARSSIKQSVMALQTVPELQAKLIDVWTQRDRFAQDLKTEQANHAQTRRNLTTALGDTVELLTKLKDEQA